MIICGVPKYMLQYGYWFITSHGYGTICLIYWNFRIRSYTCHLSIKYSPENSFSALIKNWRLGLYMHCNWNVGDHIQILHILFL